MTTKPPTPQGISALLRKAGFAKAEVTKRGRNVYENTAGFHVRRRLDEVVVNHWSASSANTGLDEDLREGRAMLTRYAGVIEAAGWGIDTTTPGILRVYAKGDPLRPQLRAEHEAVCAEIAGRCDYDTGTAGGGPRKCGKRAQYIWHDLNTGSDRPVCHIHARSAQRKFYGEITPIPFTPKES